MKFLLDENLSPRHAGVLNAAGHSTLAAAQAGLSGASDADVRAFAIREERVLITLDADFGNIMRFSCRDARYYMASAQNSYRKHDCILARLYGK